MSTLDEYMSKLREMMDFHPDTTLPEHLVVGPDDAHWIGPEIIHNPSRLGILVDCPAKT
ncbi:MAG: hypothetical protein QOF29_3601, partial [bacterium]